MRVKVLTPFGNHEPGDICDSVRKLENGRRVDSQTDRQAFAHWIEVGWAEQIEDDEGKPPRRRGKQIDEAPKDKSVASSETK